MAQTTIAAVAVEVSIAKVWGVVELLKAVQRRGITLLVFGPDLAEMRRLERQGLVVGKVHGEPSAREPFARRCVALADMAANRRLAKQELLFVDRDEQRLASYAAYAGARVVCFNPDTEDVGALRGRLGDYGLVGDEPSRAAVR